MHRGGEKTFIDHAGDTIDGIDPATGQRRPAYVFVAGLGASNYTNAEATWRRRLLEWIGSHTRALSSSFENGPALQPLPQSSPMEEDERAEDYHVELDRHCYSVPYQLAQQVVDLRFTATVLEVLHRGKRVASHVRSAQQGTTTDSSHQPESHQRYRDWMPTRLRAGRSRTGGEAAQRVASAVGPAGVLVEARAGSGSPRRTV